VICSKFQFLLSCACFNSRDKDYLDVLYVVPTRSLCRYIMLFVPALSDSKIPTYSYLTYWGTLLIILCLGTENGSLPIRLLFAVPVRSTCCQKRPVRVCFIPHPILRHARTYVRHDAHTAKRVCGIKLGT
jgi:hypothetical protein